MIRHEIVHILCHLFIVSSPRICFLYFDLYTPYSYRCRNNNNTHWLAIKYRITSGCSSHIIRSVIGAKGKTQKHLFRAAAISPFSPDQPRARARRPPVRVYAFPSLFASPVLLSPRLRYIVVRAADSVRAVRACVCLCT